MSDFEDYRLELIDSVMKSSRLNQESPSFEFIQEITRRLTDAEEFEDFIPSYTEGAGQRQKKIRLDGYEISDVDDSVRLLISDFSGGSETETLTKTRMDSLFNQLRSFIQEVVSGRYSDSSFANEETRGIADWIENYHVSKITRYDLYLLTDCRLSERVSHIQMDDVEGVSVRFHVWDITRMFELSQSVIGAEELTIDFTDFGGGLHCLAANNTSDYKSFLCVIPAEMLTTIFDQYGPKLLEGNVRSFLGTRRKENQRIQGTIRSEPQKFFVFNNGISATGTDVETISTETGLKIKSVRYLQLVNGGQTTASLSTAKRVDKADLSEIFVPMKLTIVTERDGDKMNKMIQDISRYSNSQAKVDDTDFFSNHQFHLDFETLSRTNPAPRKQSETFATYWFYERSRGQYQNATAKMTPTQRKEFIKQNPRVQKIIKTDLAKFENSWNEMPYDVSKAAAKNFIIFAKNFDGDYSSSKRAKYNNAHFFKEAIARAILFKGTETLVSAAKGDWYHGGWRAQIVTYTVAKLAHMIREQAAGQAMDFLRIWNSQGLSEGASKQLEQIAKKIAETINEFSAAGANVGELCKKVSFWDGITALDMKLREDFIRDLIDSEEARSKKDEGKKEGIQEQALEAEIAVAELKLNGTWSELLVWSETYQPIFGKELDLIKLAAHKSRVPTTSQAKLIIKVLNKQKEAGFRENGS